MYMENVYNTHTATRTAATVETSQQAASLQRQSEAKPAGHHGEAI